MALFMSILFTHLILLNYQRIAILTNRLPSANLTHALEVKIYTNISLFFFL